MPYYEYVCTDCSTLFELKRSMKEIDEPTICPECHSDHVTRQISKIFAFAHSESGSVSSLGGGGCSSCSSGACSSCGSRN